MQDIEVHSRFHEKTTVNLFPSLSLFLFILALFNNQRNRNIKTRNMIRFLFFFLDVCFRVCLCVEIQTQTVGKLRLINKDSSHTQHNTQEKSLAVGICSLRVPALYLQSPSSQKRSSETGGTAALKPHDPAQETMPGSVYHGLICISDVNHPKGRGHIMQVT